MENGAGEKRVLMAPTSQHYEGDAIMNIENLDANAQVKTEAPNALREEFLSELRNEDPNPNRTRGDGDNKHNPKAEKPSASDGRLQDGPGGGSRQGDTPPDNRNKPNSGAGASSETLTFTNPYI